MPRDRYTPPTTPTGIAADINASLGKYKAGALNIFGEWFSKPGGRGQPSDPQYTITGATVDGTCLLISFDVDSGWARSFVRVWDPEEYAWSPSLFQIRTASRVLLTDYGGAPPVPEDAFYVDCVVQKGRVTGRINPEPPHEWDPFRVMRRNRPAVTLW